MIGFIRGILAEKGDGYVLIDVNGIGYEVHVPANSRAYLAAEGSEITVYTSMIVREDDKAFIANFYKYGFVGLVLEWIDEGMKEDPKLIIERLNSLIQGTFDHALNNAKLNNK